MTVAVEAPRVIGIAVPKVDHLVGVGPCAHTGGPTSASGPGEVCRRRPHAKFGGQLWVRGLVTWPCKLSFRVDPDSRAVALAATAVGAAVALAATAVALAVGATVGVAVAWQRLAVRWLSPWQLAAAVAVGVAVAWAAGLSGWLSGSTSKEKSALGTPVPRLYP